MPVACFGLEVSFGVNHNQREWKTFSWAFYFYHCFLCFLLFWCPLLPFIETGTLKIYTKMVLYMKNEIFDLKYPPWGLNPHSTNLRVVFFL